MIYQHNSTFGIFTHMATYEGRAVYGNSPEEINDYIKRFHEMSGTETALVLPEISPVTVTTEQQSRFDEVSKIAGVTLDDVTLYTLEGKDGTSTAYQSYRQKQEVLLALAELAEKSEMDKLETQLAIAELAELATSTAEIATAGGEK